MFKKIIYIMIIFNLVSHCGFTPIHLNDVNSNFSISSLEFEGDRVINNFLKINLEKYKNSKHDKIFNIKIISDYKKIIISKDKTANTTNYELSSKTIFLIFSGDKIIKELTIIEKNNR